MKKNIIKKIFSTVLILASVFFNIQQAKADTLSDMTSGTQAGIKNWTESQSPTTMATQIFQQISKEAESRYHVSLQGIQQSSESMNTAYLKRDFPQVSFTFSPSNPKEGEKVTAMANPMYFSMDNNQLYYTWYLVHKNDADNKDWNGKNGNCHLDSKGENIAGDSDIEDCKIEATRILAQGGWEPNWRDYNLDPTKYINKISDLYVAYYANAKVSNTDDDGYEASIGGEKSDSSKCYIGEFDTGKAYEMVEKDGKTSKCNHLFPDAKGNVGGKNINETTGDNSFGKDEEQFWGTDPSNPSTAGNGNKDEANIAGLGQMQFSWNYQAGDKIGVAVEGRSLKPTKYDNTVNNGEKNVGASMMVMWALSKDTCKMENKDKGTKTININTAGMTGEAAGFSGSETINTTTTNINDCLGKNLVDPMEGGQATQMKPALSVTPENPMQDSDPAGTDTDTIDVQASFENAESSLSNIYYEWKIQSNKSISGSFTTICDQDMWKENKCKNNATGESNVNEINRLAGNNLSSISFKPNLAAGDFDTSGDNNGIIYLKIHLDAYENFPSATNTTRVGRTDVIIKLIRPYVKLEAFVPTATETSLAFDNGTKICGIGNGDVSDIQKYICFVTPNQIIGAQLVNDSSNSNFKYSWMLNEKPLYFDPDYCSDQACKDGKMVYFPASSQVGDQYNLILNLSDEKTGKTMQLGKMFEVIEPYVKIVSSDEASWPKYLGRYEDVNGACDKISDSAEKLKCQENFYDFSDSIFETNNGNAVKLKAEYHPAWIAGDVEVYNKNKQWLLDGEEQGDNLSNDLSLAATKDVGEIYDIEFNAIYNQSPSIRRALNNIWGISSFDSVESDLSSSIQIETVENSTITKSNEEKAILASVLGNTSENIIFLLRLILTIALMIFVSGLVFAVAPRRTYLE